MNSPVMQALVNAKMQEAPSAFGRWCVLRGIRYLPAAPAHVAAFLRDCEAVAPMPQIWEAVREISDSHLANGLADPTAGGMVAEAINSIAKVAPPRSWHKDQWPRFFQLPYDLQLYVVEREHQRDKALRKSQNEFATARQKLQNIEQPPKVTDGIQSENITA